MAYPTPTGRPYKIIPYQKEFVKAFLNPAYSTLCLSVGRGAGKSGLLGLLSAGLLDPQHEDNANNQITIISPTFAQSQTITESVISHLGIKRAGGWRSQNSDQHIKLKHDALGMGLTVRSAVPSRLHGMGGGLVNKHIIICDEPAQFLTPRILNVLQTGLGKCAFSKLVLIGTKSDSSSHAWNQLLSEDSPGTYRQVYGANLEEDKDRLFDEAFWYEVIPSLRYGFPDIKQLRFEAAKAQKSKDSWQAFVSLRLNAGVSEFYQSRLIDPLEFELQCETTAEELPPRIGVPTIGVDLGESLSFTSAVAVYDNGRVEHFSQCPDTPDLSQRGRDDGVGEMYVEAHRRGELLTNPGQVISVQSFVAELVDRWGIPAMIACDDWRYKELCQALEAEGISLARIDKRRMGVHDSGTDIRLTRRSLLQGHLKMVPSILMRHAIAQGLLKSDDSANWKWVKRNNVRDDPAVALTLAEGCRVRHARSSPVEDWGICF